MSSETIADIVAELRRCPTNTVLGGMVSLICNRLADRIETAWKQERVEIATYAATQGVKLTNEKYANMPAGNAAAMREAQEGGAE